MVHGEHTTLSSLLHALGRRVRMYRLHTVFNECHSCTPILQLHIRTPHRHAGGQTLPNLNFCIPGEVLAPVVALLQHAAAAAQAGSAAEPGAHSLTTRDRLRLQLAGLDVRDEQAERVWQLRDFDPGAPPLPPTPRAPPRPTSKL